jgi:hypothetical protein
LEKNNSVHYSQIKQDDYSLSMVPRTSPLPMDYSDYFCQETLSESGNLEENVGDYCQRALLAARPEYECGLNSPLFESKGVLNSKVVNLGSDTFGNPIFQKCLQN